MSDAFFWECFISGLKDEIYAHVLMVWPQIWVEATKIYKEAQQVVSSQTWKPSFIPLPKLVTLTPSSTLIKIHKLTWEEMFECQLKGLFYNCDEKYFPGHKCKEQKLFMGISEDVPEEDVTVPLVEELSLPDTTQEHADPPEVDPLIFLHALTGFSTHWLH